MKQVIVIKLDGVSYGIDVNIVQEVVYQYAERSVPDAPNFIEGLAYVRNQLLPIVKTKRLFNSSFFDLYAHKKILVLSFARMRGDNQANIEDTSSVGIVIDDVVGIEAYEESDLQGIPSLYSAKISSNIVGFIKRKEVDVAILNIAQFFLDTDGHFRYQRYISASESLQYDITKEDLLAAEKAVEGIFPFIPLTRKAILTYLSRIAIFENTSIVDFLRKNPQFFQTNIHTQQRSGKDLLYSNAADMYMLLDYIESRYKADKSMNLNILIIDHSSSMVMESLCIALSARYASQRNRFHLTQYVVDGQTPEERFRFTKDMLEKVTEELIPQYFDFDEQRKLYAVKETYRNRMSYTTEDIKEMVHMENKFDIIYAPNFLVSHVEHLDESIQILYNIMNPQGILALGLLEDIEDFVKFYKKYYIKSRLVFVRS